MRSLARPARAGRRATLIFLLAILVPTLVIGHLGFSAVSTRREGVGRLLESNLWSSSQAAARAIEQELLAHEEAAIGTDVVSLSASDSKGVPSTERPPSSVGASGRVFILDASFRVVVPRSGSANPPASSASAKGPASGAESVLQAAESLEFAERDGTRAAAEYARIASGVGPDRVRALALEGLGRTSLSSRRFADARAAYSTLISEHGQIRNRAGHPYALVSALQLFEVERRQDRAEVGLRMLLDAYAQLRDGAWTLNAAAFGFFGAEIEAIFDAHLRDGAFPAIEEAYRRLQSQPAPYGEELAFAHLLDREAIPRLLERHALSGETGAAEPARFLVTTDGGIRLVSYRQQAQAETGARRVRAFLWDIDALEAELLPRALDAASRATGLDIRTAPAGEPIDGTDAAAGAGQSVTLALRDFPLPWRLVATQPAFAELELASRRENYSYGALFASVFVLMLLGATLLLRDISREAETTRLRSEFVHNVSHELKTPLTLIRLFGDTLLRKEGLSREEKREAYTIITKESERLSHMINNILDSSRIELGRKEFSFEPGSLPAVVEETLDSYRYHLEKKGFSVAADIAAGLRPAVFDGEAVASVLVNLLSNAVSFSPTVKEVTVRLLDGGDHAVLRVEDRGVGIPDADRTKIFERFYRVRDQPGAASRGSGLGLALVKHIAEAHGGRVDVVSEVGRGSVFSVYLPFAGPMRGGTP